MRRLLSLFTSLSVLMCSIPAFADEATLFTKDLNGRDLALQIRNHSVLQFKPQGESEWKNIDMSKFESLGRRVVELFRMNDRLFYIFTEPASSSPTSQHVGEIVYRPVAHSPTGKNLAWLGVGMVAVSSVPYELLDSGSMLGIISATYFTLGFCLIAGGVLAHLHNGGTVPTVESAKPKCVSPEGDVKYEQALLTNVHRNPLGQIVDVELAVADGATTQTMSLLEITKPAGCEGEMKTPGDGTQLAKNAAK